jgi:hypothetical protein
VEGARQFPLRVPSVSNLRFWDLYCSREQLTLTRSVSEDEASARTELVASLTLRVGVKCLDPAREQYNSSAGLRFKLCFAICCVSACPFTGIFAAGGLSPVLQHGGSKRYSPVFLVSVPCPSPKATGTGRKREGGALSR